MYRVLIAEDEMFVRLGLRNSIPWGEYGMTVAADVSDGQAAWEAYEQYSPHLILTDLRMPRMDGIELIKRIRVTDKSIKIIILTCLDEFTLAQQAISLDVSAYLLKLTMTEEETDSVLSKIKKELDNKIPANITKMLPGDDKKLVCSLEEYIFRRSISSGQGTSQLATLYAEYKDDQFVLCAINICYSEFLTRKTDDSSFDEMQRFMNGMIQASIGTFLLDSAFFIDRSHTVVVFRHSQLVGADEWKIALEKKLLEVREKFRVYFNAEAIFGVSTPFGKLDELHILYEEAKSALENLFFTNKDICHAGSIPPTELSLSEILMPLYENEKILRILPTHRHRIFNEKIVNLCEISPVKSDIFLEKCTGLMQWYTDALPREIDDRGQQHLDEFVHKLKTCGSISKVPDILTEYFSLAGTYSGNPINREIEKSLQFIEQNYGDSINLDRISKYVHLNPTYFSNLFKQDMGVSFIIYLTRFRIQKARDLLRFTSMRAYEIARQVGYPEETYFSKVFKKMTGLTPYEYRKQSDGTPHVRIRDSTQESICGTPP